MKVRNPRMAALKYFFFGGVEERELELMEVVD